MQTHFQIDLMALIGVIGLLLMGYFFTRFQKERKAPSLGFSSTKTFSSFQHLGRTRWLWLPKRLYQVGLLALLIALLDPHFEKKHEIDLQTDTVKGFGFYLVLDQSGSMSKTTTDNSLPKIEVLKEVTEQFIQDRSKDLIGLVSFARTAQVLSPLTLDHQSIMQMVRQLEVVKDPSDDGTAMGYAIYKTAHLISAAKEFVKEANHYDVQGTFMVLVTDGFQDPNPLDNGNRLRTMDLQEAVEAAKKEQIHLYIINIDPQIIQNKFAPHRRLLKQLTESTGGRFYYMTGDQDLKEIYADINRIEKPFWHVEQKEIFNSRAFSFYPFFIIIGLLCLFSAQLLETTWLRRIP